MEVSLPILRDIFFENAQTFDPDASIVHEEYRTVNGQEVLSVRMNVKYQGIPFTFAGYLYGGSSGSIQLLAWTSQNLFEEYETVLFELLNGLEILENNKTNN